jgi:hypothetical protein
MGTLHHHPFLIRYQGGAGDHVVQIRAGRTIRSGVGQSFWLRAGRCALAEVPTANRAHSFLVQVPSADQQNVSAQVAITYRIEDAEAAASHYDFDLYPRDANNDAQGLWQIDETVTRIAHSALASSIGAMPLSEAISGSLERVGSLLAQAFAADEQLRATGVAVVDVRLMSLRPDEGVESSLRAPLLEQLQAEADRALYERRALAVERESQISENEMQSKLDLARKRADLVDQEGHNARREAEEKAAADAITVEAEARRIVEKAKAYEADWKTAGAARTATDASYVRALGEAGPEVARAVALKELAKNMPSFGDITITADVLSDLVSAFTGSKKAGK